ncbi:telomeric repeat-binding factor 2 isoform X1 [Protopterus annectens]|uniref:telomeric repeat-binding factor 2 isoform X1 n=1 Tax=Protopterus annectens TaxID=7888 RepID=UPI001CF9568E|nr:telomeric repeat-binding factor 2 isoform X1 [Protopterus annectens]
MAGGITLRSSPRKSLEKNGCQEETRFSGLESEWLSFSAVEEELVNTWVLKFYLLAGLQSFREGRYQDFQQIRDIIQALLVRPLQKKSSVFKMLRMMQFLSRINEGENLDCTFDTESELTPLESSLNVLDHLEKECIVSESCTAKIKNAIKEMAVLVCLKNAEFVKASDVLKRVFGNDPSLQEIKSQLCKLITKKSSQHPILQRYSYDRFKNKMLKLLVRQIKVSEPFLLKKAREALVNKSALKEKTNGQFNSEKQRERENESNSETDVEAASEPAESDKTLSPSVRQREKINTTFSRTALKMSFQALSKSEDSEVEFKKLEETNFTPPPTTGSTQNNHQQNEEKDILVSAGNAQQKRHFPNISQLVQERESQWEEENEGSEQESMNRPSVNSKDEEDDCQQSKQERISKRTNKDISTEDEKETWTGEESLFFINKRPKRSPARSSVASNGKKQKWTVEESEWIRKGVKRYGDGNWSIILKSYPFVGRTSVMVKDRWRTMKKLGLV